MSALGKPLTPVDARPQNSPLLAQVTTGQTCLGRGSAAPLLAHPGVPSSRPQRARCQLGRPLLLTSSVGLTRAPIFPVKRRNKAHLGVSLHGGRAALSKPLGKRSVDDLRQDGGARSCASGLSRCLGLDPSQTFPCSHRSSVRQALPMKTACLMGQTY